MYTGGLVDKEKTEEFIKNIKKNPCAYIEVMEKMYGLKLYEYQKTLIKLILKNKDKFTIKNWFLGDLN